MDIDALTKYGEDCLLKGEFSGSLWSLNSAQYLSLSPCLWQRGLACFYSGHYEEAAAQFKRDMKANGCDIGDLYIDLQRNYLCLYFPPCNQC